MKVKRLIGLGNDSIDLKFLEKKPLVTKNGFNYNLSVIELQYSTEVHFKSLSKISEFYLLGSLFFLFKK